MSVFDEIIQYKDFDFTGYFAQVRTSDLRRILDKERWGALDYLTMLSPRAESCLE